MRLTALTRFVLQCRRESRDMEKDGYERVSGPFDTYRGPRWGHVITDAKISADGRSVFVKIEKGETQ